MPLKEMSYKIGSTDGPIVEERTAHYVLLLSDDQRTNALMYHRKKRIYKEVKLIADNEMVFDMLVRQKDGSYLDKTVVLYGDAMNEPLENLFTCTINGIKRSFVWERE